MFIVLYRPNGKDEPRLGLAIGKKHCRLATGRSRLKRIVRESFRRHSESLGGVDVVVMNQKSATTARNSELFESLEGHWRRCRTAVDNNAGNE